MGFSNVVRAGGKRSQAWLRSNRRLERILRTARMSGSGTLYSHELVIPLNSTYAPWHDDEDFRACYEEIAGSTFVDQYKCHELWEQLGQLADVPGDILEVGVWRGGTGSLLARRSQMLQLEAEIFLADTFSGVAKAGNDDPWYRGGEHSDTSPQTVERLAESMGVEVRLLVGMFPDDTQQQISDRTLRLVHIDVDVYQSARATLEWAWPRLSVGGTVLWDDYGSFECEGVATLGRELFASHFAGGRLVHNLNGHLLLLKLSDQPLPPLRPTEPRVHAQRSRSSTSARPVGEPIS